MMKHNKRVFGFTLIEMMLVLVIAASLLVMMLNYGTQKTDQLRRDRVALQTQQILSAALSYYVNTGVWPSCTAPPCNFNTTNGNNLQSNNYVPQVIMKNPWGQPYYYNTYNSNNNFVVYTNVMTTAAAQTTVGQLPMGFVATPTNAALTPPVATGCPGAATCTAVVSSVTVPGQNLNNARSVNFAGVYHNGACIPAPACPGSMTPRVYVSVAQVTGLSGAGGASSVSVSPLNGFVAYARGATAAANASPSAAPFRCNTGIAVACTGGTTYWRACVDVTTSLGGVVSSSASGQNQTVLAITRCEPTSGGVTTEPAGSPLSIFSPT